MTVLVTGGSGYLGSGVLASLAAEHHTVGWQFSQEHSALDTVDITNREAVLEHVAAVQPDLIVHTAALIDSSSPEAAARLHQVNVEGTRFVTQGAQELGIPLVYVSSAAVFDQDKGIFSESDTPRAKSLYGQTKLAGERIVQASTMPYLIVRPSLLVGAAPLGKHKFYQRSLQELRSGQPVLLDTQWQFSPTSIAHLTEVIKWWAEAPHNLIAHVATEGRSTKYELIRALAERLGWPLDLVQPKEGPVVTVHNHSAEGSPQPERHFDTPFNLLQMETLHRWDGPLRTSEELLAELVREQTKE